MKKIYCCKARSDFLPIRSPYLKTELKFVIAKIYCTIVSLPLNLNVFLIQLITITVLS